MAHPVLTVGSRCGGEQLAVYHNHACMVVSLEGGNKMDQTYAGPTTPELSLSQYITAAQDRLYSV